jgi:hypothetical protein
MQMDRDAKDKRDVCRHTRMGYLVYQQVLMSYFPIALQNV